eukprot:5910224-Pleurochrysis_carterae.AAC.1
MLNAKHRSNASLYRRATCRGAITFPRWREQATFGVVLTMPAADKFSLNYRIPGGTAGKSFRVSEEMWQQSLQQAPTILQD